MELDTVALTAYSVAAGTVLTSSVLHYRVLQCLFRCPATEPCICFSGENEKPFLQYLLHKRNERSLRRHYV